MEGQPFYSGRESLLTHLLKLFLAHGLGFSVFELLLWHRDKLKNPKTAEVRYWKTLIKVDMFDSWQTWVWWSMTNIDVFHEYVCVFWENLITKIDERQITNKSLFLTLKRGKKYEELRREVLSNSWILSWQNLHQILLSVHPIWNCLLALLISFFVLSLYLECQIQNG